MIGGPEPAMATDLEPVLRLLQAAHLPTAGVAERFPTAYTVVRAADDLVAVAGLEAYDAVGLLRSVAVAPSMQGRGVGRLLIEERLRAAMAAGMTEVYLLTTTAADYFRRLGFVDIERTRAPAALQSSVEFAAVCPSSAVCLRKELG
jgi:amino-acid N-acetyltransferase